MQILLAHFSTLLFKSSVPLFFLGAHARPFFHAVVRNGIVELRRCRRGDVLPERAFFVMSSRQV